MDEKMQKLMRERLGKAMDEHIESNRGIDEAKMHKRADEMFAFLSRWTLPRDLICMTITNKTYDVLSSIVNAGEPRDQEEMEDFISSWVNMVIHLYALAEGRMLADVERRENDMEQRRLDPERMAKKEAEKS